MSDVTAANISRPGLIEGNSDNFEIFLELFAGEVLERFNKKTVAMPRHMVRTIKHGKSANFPASWKATVRNHTPGEELDFSKIKMGQRQLLIKDLTLADVFIDVLEEAMAHFEVRSIYTDETAIALKEHIDKNVLRAAITAARTTGTIDSTSPDGERITDANMASDKATLISGVFDAAQTLDEKDVPDEGMRSLFVKPAQFYLLIETQDAINKDWGGEGSFARARLPFLANLAVVKTNNMPDADDSANTLLSNYPDLQNDYSANVAVVTHPSAAGTVRLKGLQTEGSYDIRRQGHIIVSKYAMGHGVLRPESAVELATS